MIAVLLAQEARAQHLRERGVVFFVDLPPRTLSLSLTALILVVPNFAITFFALRRNLYRRRWPWVTTAIAAVLLGIVVVQIGWDGFWTIVDPSHR